MEIMKTISIITLFLCGTIISFAQKSQKSFDEITETAHKKTSYKDRLIDYSDIYTYKINDATKDTILYTRKINEYWFGIFGGPNLSISMGNLHSKQKAGISRNGLFANEIVNFKNSWGYGYSLGIMGERMPLDKDFGFGIQLTLFEAMVSNVNSDQLKDAFNTSYNFHSVLTYSTISIYAKYIFPSFDGFFVTSGGDIAINLGTDVYQTTNFANTGDIMHKFRLTDIQGKFRIGFKLGIGYDFFIADFFALNNRMRLTPFADLRYGTNFITDNNSSWNKVMFNFGLQLKFAPDRVKIDTLHYDSNKEEQPVYITSIKDNDIEIAFPKFDGFGIPPSINLTMAEYLSEAEPVVVSEKEPEALARFIEEKPTSYHDIDSTRIEIVPNRKFSYRFTSAESSAISKDLKAYLDELVKFMKENPKAIVRLTGHSDNHGSRAEIEAIALARANNARDYLIKYGISKNRILTWARGSLAPIATNDTESGRKANRRIEIELVLGR